MGGPRSDSGDISGELVVVVGTFVLEGKRSDPSTSLLKRKFYLLSHGNCVMGCKINIGNSASISRDQEKLMFDRKIIQNIKFRLFLNIGRNNCTASASTNGFRDYNLNL